MRSRRSEQQTAARVRPGLCSGRFYWRRQTRRSYSSPPALKEAVAEPGTGTAPWDHACMMVTGWGSRCGSSTAPPKGEAPLKRAAGEENFGDSEPFYCNFECFWIGWSMVVKVQNRGKSTPYFHTCPVFNLVPYLNRVVFRCCVGVTKL